eukprot:TRINITY_DN1994_c0_g1_i2.p1 TRINITY_DN1994_c0_g1~~TRINITY_DN1994_c0_g1_i2.p1  ORF type:complete len:661 (-),score=146.53 TRINITY_DN1994_c0_g1_i2:10-1992(-)
MCIRDRECKMRKQLDKNLVLCLLCAKKYCTNTTANFPHNEEHFITNRAHSMAINHRLEIFCYKCKCHINTARFDSANNKNYERLCQLILSAEAKQDTPAPLISPEEGLLQEKAGKPTRAEPLEKEEKRKMETPTEEKKTVEKQKPTPIQATNNLPPILTEDFSDKEEEPGVVTVKSLVIDISPERHSLREINNPSSSDIVVFPEEEKSYQENVGRSSVYATPPKKKNLNIEAVPAGENAISQVIFPSSERLSVSPTGDKKNLKKPSPKPSKIKGQGILPRGLYNLANTSYANAILQILYASVPLVAAYFNPKNSDWVNAPFHRRLLEYFISYKDGTGSFNGLPFIEEALLNQERNFDYLKEHEPIDALGNIFRALIFAHEKIVRDYNKLSPEDYVSPSETFFGKFIASVVGVKSTCTKCKSIEWAKQEKLIVPVPSKLLSEVPAFPKDKLKYSIEVVDGKEYYVPVASNFVSKTDIGHSFISHFREPIHTSKECNECKAVQDMVQEQYMITTPEILIIKMDYADEKEEKLNINRLLFLDDIWMINKDVLIRKKIEGKLKDKTASSSPMNICGFELYGVIPKRKIHSKTENSYTAYAKHGVTWYFTRDEEVVEVPESRVLASRADILFYRKTIDLIYQYACLLYTSPSPRDATLSRMPSSA